MRGRNYFWLLIFLICSPTFAADIYFTGYFGQSVPGTYSSAIAACNAMVSRCDGGLGSYKRATGVAGVTPQGSNGFLCSFTTEDRSGSTWSPGANVTVCGSNGSGVATRNGDTCPSGTSLNADKSACVYPACPVGQNRNQSGQCVPVTCTQDSTGSPIVYSPKQAKCTKYYNLDSEEMCSHLGQSKTPTATSVEVVTADPGSTPLTRTLSSKLTPS